MIHTGHTTVGLVHLATIMETAGTMVGVVITIIGTAPITDGILTLVALAITAADIGTIIGIQEPLS